MRFQTSDDHVAVGERDLHRALERVFVGTVHLPGVIAPAGVRVVAVERDHVGAPRGAEVQPLSVVTPDLVEENPVSGRVLLADARPEVGVTRRGEAREENFGALIVEVVVAVPGAQVEGVEYA